LKQVVGRAVFLDDDDDVLEFWANASVVASEAIKSNFTESFMGGTSLMSE
jgi:hypothetical protein